MYHNNAWLETNGNGADFKITVDFPQKQENFNNSNYLWLNCTKFYRVNACVDVSHSTKNGDYICSRILIMVKTKFSS